VAATAWSRSRARCNGAAPGMQGRANSCPADRAIVLSAAPLGLFPGFPLFELFLRLEVFPRFLIDEAHRKAHLAAIVEAEELDFDLVAFLDDIRSFGDPSLGELGDVDETVLR